MLDAGCGDWNWMNTLDLPGVKVYACDIVGALIAENIQKYGRKALFFVSDIVKAEEFPAVDLILCRATLFHLSNALVSQALKSMKAKARYLLLTSHPKIQENAEIQNGDFRRLNLCAPPFSMPQPARWFWDGPGEDGVLGLWPVDGH